MKNEELMLEWKEGELIDGVPLYYLDGCHGVSITDYVDRIEIRFSQRVKEKGKYYCKTMKTHTLDVKKLKDNYELIHKT